MIFNMTSGKMKTPVLSTGYPADVTVNAGTSAVFQVQITEDGLPKACTYQWYVNDSPVSGATAATYTRVTSSDKGVYSVYCVVTNKAGSVTSRTAALTVRKTPVLNSSYPADITVVKNTAVTCKVSVSTAGYPASYTYQWYKNGTAVSGATSASYTFTPTAVGTTTLYCKVTNAAGTVTSRTATVTATDLYLYNAGDQCTANSGGWKTVTGNISWTFNSDHIAYASTYPEDNNGCIYTVNKVNLSSFSKLNVDVESNSTSGISSIFVSTANTSDTYYDDCVVAYLNKSDTGRGTLSLDISSLTGSCYVGFYASASNGKIYKIWLS